MACIHANEGCKLGANDIYIIYIYINGTWPHTFLLNMTQPVFQSKTRQEHTLYLHIL